MTTPVNRSTERSTQNAFANDKASAPDLRDSLRLVLGRKTHTAPRAVTLSLSTKVSEQDLYAAIVHSKLAAVKSGLGAKFAARFGGLAAKIKSSGKDSAEFKAADRIMRGLLRSGELTRTEYRTIRDMGLGKAQLDANRTNLSRETAALGRALAAIAANKVASDDEINKFKAGQNAGAARKKTAADRSQAAAGRPLKSNVSLDTTPSQSLLWKPVSDTTGNLVVLLPAAVSGQVAAVKVLSPAGAVLAVGRYSGIANGQREHYRFAQPGGSFPDGVRLQIIMKDGSVREITITHSEARLEKKN